jgi:ABC-type tungstate transport system substrate-binding protein
MRFPGQRALLLATNTLRALPSVVVGLAVYLLLRQAAARASVPAQA